LRSVKHDTLAAVPLRVNGVAVYRNARKVYATHCVEHLVTGAKHDKLAVAAGRTRRDATGATELTGAHVTHKRAVHAEHRDTAV
jgi:hypothetical protein